MGATKEARPLLGKILPRGELKAHQNGRHLKPKRSWAEKIRSFGLQCSDVSPKRAV